MPKPIEHPIKSLTEFTKRVEDALIFTKSKYPNDPAANNWYRGIGRAQTWQLVPGLYRHPIHKQTNDLLRLERKLLASFQRESILYQPTNMSLLASSDDSSVDYEYLFFMQHYGVPTRLLDWTSNPFIALYFALTTAFFDPTANKYTEDAAVWILNPTAWNNKSLDDISYGDLGPVTFGGRGSSGYAPSKSDDETALKQIWEYPIAMYGIANNSRMFAQKGVFTIFGRDVNPMEKIYEDKNYPTESLIKLIIDKDDIDPMMKLILSIGYTDSVSYPDLHGLALEIKRLHNFKV
jgi:hypothetical protein